MRVWWIALVVLLVAGCNSEPPVYQGRPLSFYLARLKDKDADARRDAARSLGQAGDAAKGAVPALAEAVKDDNAGVRADAAEALSRMGPDAKPAIPALLDALKDQDKQVRSHACLALSTIDPADSRVVEPLITALQDPDLDVRKSAIAALRRVGLEHKARVIPALKAIFKRVGEDEEVRKMAQGAIEAIDPTAAGP